MKSLSTIFILEMLRRLSPILSKRLAKSKTVFSSVTIAENTDGYEVLIDNRKLRVPNTADVLKIKSRDIAEIVGLEWVSQPERDLTKIMKYTLYMTQLCYTEQELRREFTKEMSRKLKLFFYEIQP